MMNERKKAVEAFERALFEAGRRRPAAAVAGERWRAALMADIRRRSPRRLEAEEQTFAARLAWRLSAAAACAALALLIYAMKAGFVDYEELAMRFLEDPVRFLI